MGHLFINILFVCLFTFFILMLSSSLKLEQSTCVMGYILLIIRSVIFCIQFIFVLNIYLMIIDKLLEFCNFFNKFYFIDIFINISLIKLYYNILYYIILYYTIL